jgi:hypothetical protein
MGTVTAFEQQMHFEAAESVPMAWSAAQMLPE